MNTITEEEALNRMAAYCSAAEHCKAEVNEKLQKWGLPYEVINRIIDRLVVEKFIDEERYCRACVIFILPHLAKRNLSLTNALQ